MVARQDVSSGCALMYRSTKGIVQQRPSGMPMRTLGKATWVLKTMYSTTKAFISLVRYRMYLLKETHSLSALRLYIMGHVKASLGLTLTSAHLCSAVQSAMGQPCEGSNARCTCAMLAWPVRFTKGKARILACAR